MKKIAIASLFMTMTFLPNVYAEGKCENIMWSPDMTQSFPQISQACVKTEERNGQTVVLVEADFIRVTGGKKNVVYDVHLNDGTKVRNTSAINDVKVNNTIDFQELPRGYKMSIYIPTGKRFKMMEVNADITEEKLIAANSLPKTATIMPTLGVLGGIFMLLGFAIRMKRSRNV